MSNGEIFGQLLVSEDFFQTLEELKRLGVSTNSNEMKYEGEEIEEYSDYGSVSLLEEDEPHRMSAQEGYNQLETDKIRLCAYDETMISVPALEGIGYFFAHSLVLLGETKYAPLVRVSFHFYTRSRTIANGSTKLTYCRNATIQSKLDYVSEKSWLLSQYVPNGSILLIDGPLVGSQLTSQNVKLSNSLLTKNVIPIFIVKNSTSSLVVDNVPKLQDRFNCDLEWAYKTLETSSRTPLAYYQDAHSPEKNKVFSYVKVLNSSPLRVEFHYDTYVKYKSYLDSIFNVIAYEVACQGNISNPQPKIIGVAERFARETLSINNIKKMLENIHITPIINFTRFGWYSV